MSARLHIHEGIALGIRHCQSYSLTVELPVTRRSRRLFDYESPLQRDRGGIEAFRSAPAFLVPSTPKLDQPSHRQCGSQLHELVPHLLQPP